MRTIHLHGELGKKFHPVWNLDVRTPAEAVRAIQANDQSFVPYLLESGREGVTYRFVINDTHLTVDGLKHPIGKADLHIVPEIAGSKSKFATLAIGAALIVASGGLSTTAFIAGSAAGTFGAMSVASVTLNIGMGLVLSGVAQMLVKTPSQQTSSSTGQQVLESYYFNGAVNTGSQGSAVPIGYGTLLTGSIPISSGLTSENML